LTARKPIAARAQNGAQVLEIARPRNGLVGGVFVVEQRRRRAILPRGAGEGNRA
jgi:hypothetical protein